MSQIEGEQALWLEGMFASQPFMHLLGVEVTSFSPGRCELTLTHRPDLDQHSGVIHAGAISALADNAAGGAASTLMPPGRGAVTAEYKISFMAPARGQRLVARAEVLRPGKTLTFCESRVYDVAEGVEALCAVALVTLSPIRTEAPLHVEREPPIDGADPAAGIAAT